MIHFIETGLGGAWLIEHERREDERGFFARTWCREEFENHGIQANFAQGNFSFNRRRGTLRGLHFQLPPSREGKLVRCSRGELFDVIVDLRCDSPTFNSHYAVILSATAWRSLYVPPGFAHGFQTLADNTEVVYEMGDFYRADLASGARWNDPAFGIRWPIGEPSVMTERDRNYPDFSPGTFTAFRGY
jgi:dTDP-4-dehydrorhamnose 3,5-epimerase